MKPGYTAITVNKRLYGELKRRVKTRGFRSISRYLEWLLSLEGTSTGTSTNYYADYGKSVESMDSWCGGRDSNPRRPTPRDLKSRPSGRDLALCPGSGTPASKRSN